MLIDDDEIINYVHQMVIANAGIDTHIQIVQNGREAIEYLTKTGKYAHDTHPFPGVILLDINMPLMNGWEFLEAYEQLPESIKARILVAMLTTSLNPDDADRASKHADIKGFINKPLDQQGLQTVLRQYSREVKLV